MDNFQRQLRPRTFDPIRLLFWCALAVIATIWFVRQPALPRQDAYLPPRISAAEKVVIKKPVAAQPVVPQHLAPALPRPAAKPMVPVAPPAEVSQRLIVPMVYQAPFSKWDAMHEETCEEAAMLMLMWHSAGVKEVSRDEMDKWLYRLVAFEDSLGYGPSINLEKVMHVMREELDVETVEVPLTSIDDLRAQLAAGQPIIIPADGKKLKNPNFRDGGPVYHMLVVTGYDAKTREFITNEPGTRLGHDFRYPAARLFDAIRDYADDGTATGKQAGLVLAKAPAAANE